MPSGEDYRGLNRRESDLKFESLREEFREVQRGLDILATRITEQTSTIQKSLDAHERAVNGNNGTPGCKVRFARLEDDAERRSWWGRAFGGALVVVVAERLWSLASTLFSRPHN